MCTHDNIRTLRALAHVLANFVDIKMDEIEIGFE